MVAILEAKLGKQFPAKPNLRLVTNDCAIGRTSEEITREFRLRRIRWIAKFYKLRFLIDQHSFGVKKIEDLDDEKLLELHRDMEQARECIAEGISLEDVGLIKTQQL